MIDAGDPVPIIRLIGDNALMGIFLTHAHYDHIYGLNDICKTFPNCPIYTNLQGYHSLLAPSENLSFYHDAPFTILYPERVIIVDDHKQLYLFRENVIISLYTPGHHNSCISWICNDSIFSGDSYIPGFKTETRLSGGNKENAISSENIIKALGKNKKIYPGHEPKRPHKL